MTTQKALPNDLIDSLLSNYQKPEDLIGENGLLKQLTKALVERALQAEMTEHLGHNKHEPVNNSATVKVIRLSKVNLASYQLRFPVSVMGVLSLN